MAQAGDEIIGFAYGMAHESKEMAVFPEGCRYLEIEDIYICPEYRNTGAGSALLEKLLECAHKNSIDHSLIYSSTKDMESIMGFYKKHGYKTWNIQMYR